MPHYRFRSRNTLPVLGTYPVNNHASQETCIWAVKPRNAKHLITASPSKHQIEDTTSKKHKTHSHGSYGSKKSTPQTSASSPIQQKDLPKIFPACIRLYIPLVALLDPAGTVPGRAAKRCGKWRTTKSSSIQLIW